MGIPTFCTPLAWTRPKYAIIVPLSLGSAEFCKILWKHRNSTETGTNSVARLKILRFAENRPQLWAMGNEHTGFVKWFQLHVLGVTHFITADECVKKGRLCWFGHVITKPMQLWSSNVLGWNIESDWDAWGKLSVIVSSRISNVLACAMKMHRLQINAEQKSKWASRVLRPARHIIGHFGDESFQAIICTGTDNKKQPGENTPRTQNE